VNQTILQKLQIEIATPETSSKLEYILWKLPVRLQQLKLDVERAWWIDPLQVQILRSKKSRLSVDPNSLKQTIKFHEFLDSVTNVSQI
jgi:hypothetical protein